MCVSLYNNNNIFGYTQTFRKRGTCESRTTSFHTHTSQSGTEAARRGLETYHESWLKYILGPHEFLVHQSVTHPDSRIHGQETETQRIWTWRRRSLAPPPLSKGPSKSPAKSTISGTTAAPAYPQMGHLCLHVFYTPNRPFSLLQGAVKTLLQLPGTVWLEQLVHGTGIKR